MDNTNSLRMKRKRDKLRKRRNTLFGKAHELGKSDDIDVAVIVFQKGRYFTYRSSDKESFPPAMSQIYNWYPSPENLLPHDMQEKLSQKKEISQKKVPRTKKAPIEGFGMWQLDPQIELCGEDAELGHT